jgi:hypothetical protein
VFFSISVIEEDKHQNATIKLRCEWEDLCKPEESEYKTETTDHDTYLEHILSLDETC